MKTILSSGGTADVSPVRKCWDQGRDSKLSLSLEETTEKMTKVLSIQPCRQHSDGLIYYLYPALAYRTNMSRPAGTFGNMFAISFPERNQAVAQRLSEAVPWVRTHIPISTLTGLHGVVLAWWNLFKVQVWGGGIVTQGTAALNHWAIGLGRSSIAESPLGIGKAV